MQIMKRMYLASSIDITAGSIARDIGQDPKKLKLVFISTAAEPEKGDKQWLQDDRNGLVKAGFNLFDYTITGKTLADIERDLKEVDIIHVNGGNSFYLLLQARKSGFEKWIRKVIISGEKIYLGSSAGSMIAAPNIEIAKKVETRDYEGKLKSFESFGLVNFLAFPHWGSESFKSIYLKHGIAVAYKPENKIILLNDWQYIRVEGNSYRIIDIRD